MIARFINNKIHRLENVWLVDDYTLESYRNQLPDNDVRYLICDYNGLVIGSRHGNKPTKRVFFDNIMVILDDRFCLEETDYRIKRHLEKFHNRWRHCLA